MQKVGPLGGRVGPPPDPRAAGWARPAGAIQPEDVCNNNIGYYKILLDTQLEQGAFQRLACLTYWDKLFG